MLYNPYSPKESNYFPYAMYYRLLKCSAKINWWGNGYWGWHWSDNNCPADSVMQNYLNLYGIKSNV